MNFELFDPESPNGAFVQCGRFKIGESAKNWQNLQTPLYKLTVQVLISLVVLTSETPRYIETRQ